MMFLFKYLVSEEFFLVTEPYLANHSFVFSEWNVKEYSEPVYSIQMLYRGFRVSF